MESKRTKRTDVSYSVDITEQNIGDAYRDALVPIAQACKEALVTLSRKMSPKLFKAFFTLINQIGWI